MAAAAILDFQKGENFNGGSAVGGKYASPCQISWKSVKQLRRYHDLVIFQNGIHCRLGFSKIQNFNG